MNVNIEESWKAELQEEFEKEYFSKLVAFVKAEYQSQKIFPPGKEIFRAFDLCKFEKVKVVILGSRPISWSRASQWPVFLSQRWSAVSSFIN